MERSEKALKKEMTGKSEEKKRKEKSPPEKFLSQESSDWNLFSSFDIPFLLFFCFVFLSGKSFMKERERDYGGNLLYDIHIYICICIFFLDFFLLLFYSSVCGNERHGSWQVSLIYFLMCVFLMCEKKIYLYIVIALKKKRER